MTAHTTNLQAPSSALDTRVAELARTGALSDLRMLRRIALALVAGLPLDASERAWLEHGRAYAAGLLPEQALQAVRVQAWDAIEGRDCDAADPQVSRVRALLCVLYPDDELGEPDMYLETLLDFYAGAGGSAARALEILVDATPPAA